MREAVRANAEEKKTMAGYPIAGRARGGVVAYARAKRGFVSRHVIDAAASLALYMIVLAGIGVKPIDASRGRQHEQPPLVREHRKVTVYRAKAYLGVFFP